MSEAVATSQQGLVEKYQPYPEYDDSGIEWLGRIPVHWKLATLKHECVFSGGGTPTKDNLAYWGGNIPWISPKDMKSQVVTDSIDKITAVAVAESSTKLVPEGALLMVVRSGILQRTIPVAINTVPVTLNQDMKALRFKSKDKACFFLYYIQGLESQLLLEWCKQGATVESIEHELLANARYPLPPNDELKAINQFLDYETARIDRLIAQQQRLIELLKEKRQAVISHAVTKGLNPNAPMKYSGVEWLGQVPEHWAIAKLGYRYEVLLGKMLDEKKISGEHLGSYLRNTDIQWGRINTENLPQMDFRPDEVARYSVKKGDLLVCEGGDVGRSAIWNSEENCFYQKALHRLRPYDKSKDLTGFLLFVLFNAVHQGRFNSGAGKATIVHLPAEAFRQYRFAFPPLNEQVEIVNCLTDITAVFESLENKTNYQIKLLSERRTALISAAVTGKIDLRGWTPPAEEVAA